MGSLAAVGVDDDLAAGQTGVAVRASDHELAGRVDVKDDLGVEQGGDPWFDDGPDSRKKNLEDILFDLVVHRLVDSILSEPGNGLLVAHPAEFGGDEFVVLGGNHYGVDPHRVVGLVIFDGELGFGVRPQVRHQLRVVVADAGENLEGDVGEIERQRKIVLGVAAGIAEHHSLVAGPLLVRVLPDHTAVDVVALLVDCRKHSAGRAVEHVFALVVADAVDDTAYRLLDVHIGILGAHFAADYHQSGGAESLTGHLGLFILTEELVEDGV